MNTNENAYTLSDPDWLRAVEFHGHMCPGLAYGFRAAKVAMREFQVRSLDEEIVAVVENDSCAVDAIQTLVGCTFGKGNLVFRDMGKQVYTFFSRGTGKGLRIAVEFRDDETPEESGVWQRFREGDRSADTLERVNRLRESKIRKILGAREEAILKVSAPETGLPAKARIYPSVRCSRCGEKVMEPRTRLHDGAVFCIPCHEKR